MNSSLVTQALKLHGKNLWTVLEGAQQSSKNDDRSNAASNNTNSDPDDSSVQRLQGISHQERKRKKQLCQFIAKKADILFKTLNTADFYVQLDKDVEELCAVMPPLETFMGVPGNERRKHFFETVTKGDVLLGYISNKQEKGFVITVLCLDAGKRREIHDLDIKIFCPINQIPSLSVHESLFDSYQVKDLVRGVVLSVAKEQEKIVISMKTEALPVHLQHILKLGLISEEEIPVHHRRTIEMQGKSYMDILRHTRAFNNPTTANHICVALGLPSWKAMSLVKGLSSTVYPEEEYASALRKIQSAKWAYKSVKDGVSHFKSGNHTEAFQCLNKALQIDPINTEALVARGALYANNDNYRKALEDFEMALDANPNHGNARKYMSETLVALGKYYERRGELEGALKTYRKAVQVNPNNQEAKEALLDVEARERKREKDSPPKKHPARGHMDPALSHSFETRDKLKQLLKEDHEKHKKKSRYSSSSSTSSSSSRSNSSCSTTSSSHSSRSPKKHRRHKGPPLSAKAKDVLKQDLIKVSKCADEKPVIGEGRDKWSKAANNDTRPWSEEPNLVAAEPATITEQLKEERIIREVPNAPPMRKPSPKVFFVMNKKKDIPLSKIYGHSSLIDDADSPIEGASGDAVSRPPVPDVSNSQPPVPKIAKEEVPPNKAAANFKARNVPNVNAKLPAQDKYSKTEPKYVPRRSYSRSRSRSRDRSRPRYRSRSRSRSRSRYSGRSYSRSPGRRYRHRHRDSESPRYHHHRRRSRSRSRSRSHSRSRHYYYDDHYRSHSPHRYSRSHGRSKSRKPRYYSRLRPSRRPRKTYDDRRSPGVDIISRAPDLEFFKKLKAEKAAQQLTGDKPLVSAKITKAVIIQNLTDCAASSGLEAAKLAAQKINETLKSAENSETSIANAEPK